MRYLVLFLLSVVYLNASLFDYFAGFSLSDKAKRAQNVMAGFDPLVEKALKDYGVPGLSIGVVVDGHLVYAKGFGMRDLEKKLPMTADTVCPIGSFTKGFTAFAMGTLVDASLLSWDEKVIDLLPEFRLNDLYATQKLTVRDLLTHRSGMPRHDFMWYNSKMSRAEVLRRLQYLEPSCEPRARYQYNNLMYLVVGYVMEQLTHKSWETIVKEKILTPLQMIHTHFSLEEMQRENDHAVPYVERGGVLRKMKHRDISLIGPGGGLNSSVNDLSHWLQMLLAQGVYEGRSLISSSTLQEIYTPQVVVTGVAETKEEIIQAYGMGWYISSYRGQYFLSHDGVSDGFTSVIGLLPHRGIGVVVLTNRNLSSLARVIALQAIDRALELPPIDWVQEGMDAMRKGKEGVKENKLKEDLSRKKGTTSSHPLEDFVGSYEHPGYGVISIELVAGRLQITFNGITSLLDHWHYDVFQIAEETQEMFFSREGTKISFRNNLMGEVAEILVPFEPKIQDIVFTRKAKESHSDLSYLRQFTGVYEVYGYTVEISMRGQGLCAIIPGQPVYELVPSPSENEFTVKALSGYTVRFVLDENKQVTEVLLVQPYGALTATPKK